MTMVPRANTSGGYFCLSQTQQKNVHSFITNSTKKVIAIDQCQEQNNMLVKGDSGIIRLIESQQSLTMKVDVVRSLIAMEV